MKMRTYKGSMVSRKNLSLLAFSLLLASTTFGQSSQVTKGNNFYHVQDFKAAAKTYEKVLRSDPENAPVVINLIDCYLKTGQEEIGGNWLMSFLNDTADPGHLKSLAQVMAANGRYKDATILLQKATELGADEETVRWLNAYMHLSQYFADSARFKISKAAFSSASSDFSPVYYQDGLVFSSARGTEKTDTKQAAFIDLYYVPGNVSAAVPFSREINSDYHEGPLTFNASQDTVYFTRNNFRRRSLFSKAATNKLRIYMAVLQNGKWKQAQEFPFNREAYSVGHPALSGSNVMYFVSDMPGGFGGADLYKTVKVGGVWQEPVNLGEGINTSGNDLFPFVADDGTLYFASNGHPGLGGLDIFFAPVTDKGFGAVKNMGYPVNTSGDDFGLILKGNTGYFSSNKQQLQNDDIYTLAIVAKQGRTASEVEQVKRNVAFKIKSQETGLLKEDRDYRKPAVGLTIPEEADLGANLKGEFGQSKKIHNESGAQRKTEVAAVVGKTHRYYVVAGSFKSAEGARLVQQRLKQKGLESKVLAAGANAAMHRVTVADFASREEALKMLPKLKAKYGTSAWLLNY
ncbi:SPOR domain-containing protein [Pontibacter sp. MBLB2868]|uniref:SPOR domain-containing protein n=1 Tax=Pontibacter sp. MBLB2868 TaxID=3451555 RepID=UPI003F753FD3